MKFVIDNAKRLADGIWLAPLIISDAKKLGQPANAKGGCSVVLLKKVSGTNDMITFEPNDVNLLNLGDHDFSVFIESTSGADVTVPQEALSATRKDGFENVIQQCRRLLRKGFSERAVAMLTSLQKDSDDDLVGDKTNRWISRPDNYFTIKVQPQKRDLVVTVRGRPAEYPSKSIKVFPDQNGYSKFWIRDAADIPEATRIIRSARIRGRLR